MASKFHVNGSGDVRPCNASVRPCRFGEADHFENRSEALAAVEKRLSEEHGSSSSLKKSTDALKAELKKEPTGMFAVKTQEDLSSLIHGTKRSPCPGDCDNCIKFNKAAEKVRELASKGVFISLQENDSKVTPVGKFQAWCENCQNGENTKFYDAADWADQHAKAHGATDPAIKAKDSKLTMRQLIDENRIARIKNVSSGTYERAVTSMESRSKSIAVLAGLSSYNSSHRYSEQVTDLPKQIRDAEEMLFTKDPLSNDAKALLDNAVANYSMEVKEAAESDWDDSDKMNQIEQSAGRLSTTFKNLVKARRGQ
jgi:hypothetical protein